MFWIIVAYILLTGGAIYIGHDEGIFDTDNIFEFCIRVIFLLTIGWFIALFTAVGGILLAVGLTVGKQTIGIQFAQSERFFALSWAGRWIGRQLKRLIPKRKEKEVETCTNDSQSDPERF